MYKIEADLATNKNIAHNLCLPEPGDVVCIKNYLRLKAKITTVKKVTKLEEQDILNNIYKAIYKSFNARQLDFGEEIPYESVVKIELGEILSPLYFSSLEEAKEELITVTLKKDKKQIINEKGSTMTTLYLIIICHIYHKVAH